MEGWEMAIVGRVAAACTESEGDSGEGEQSVLLGRWAAYVHVCCHLPYLLPLTQITRPRNATNVYIQRDGHQMRVVGTQTMHTSPYTHLHKF